MKRLLVFLVALVLTFAPFTAAQQSLPQGYSQWSRGFGLFNATVYNQWKAVVVNGNLATGAQTIQVQYGQYALPDGSLFQPFNVNAPITIDFGSNQETVTPTAVSGCNLGAGNPLPSLCNVTATFANTHGQGAPIFSGSFGLQEAINDSFLKGGGLVTIDKAWGGTQSTITSATPYWNVSIVDTRNAVPVYWNPTGGATSLATPTTLTAVTALPSTTPVGAFTATNYNMCIAYVDAQGQEGNCSTSFVNTGAGATSSFIFSAPAASAGAVGYTIYIGLTGAGSATLQYKVPLVSQPTVVGTAPVSNGVCTLSTVETITPACSVANTTYGTTGSVATVTAITVNTSPIQPQATTTSTTSVYVPNPGGRTTLVYAPGAHLGSGGTVTGTLAFTIGAAAATTVPNVVGTINIAPGFMNVVGKTLRVCGEATTTASTATIVDIQFQWDAMGQNTAGKGVLIGDLTATPAAAIATAGHATFCQDFQTTVASASATGGSINHTNSFGAVGGVTLIAPGALSDAVTPGAIGSLNLAVDARINIIYLHTTGTDGAGWTLQNVSAQVI